MQLDQREQFLVRNDEVARQLDVADAELVAFADVDGDVDVALVGRDGNLGRVDVEVHIAPIEVVGTQCLQVGAELLLRVLVGIGRPGPKARGGQFEQVEQGFVVEHFVADDVDLLDLGDTPFRDLEVDRDAVAFERRHRTGDLDRVPALREVGPAQFLLDLGEQRTVEHAALGKPDLSELLDEKFRADRTVAFERDARDRGAFDHRHHQRRAVLLDTHVTKETGLEERADGLGRGPGIDLVANLERQVVEHRARGDSLQSLDTNVADDEIRRGFGPWHGAERQHRDHQEGE